MQEDTPQRHGLDRGIMCGSAPSFKREAQMNNTLRKNILKFPNCEMDEQENSCGKWKTNTQKKTERVMLQAY